MDILPHKKSVDCSVPTGVIHMEQYSRAYRLCSFLGGQNEFRVVLYI